MCLCVGLKPYQAPPPPINFARNSPAACSNIEFVSLELQRFWGVSKNDRDKLRAKFGRRWCRCCPWAPQPDPVGQVGRLSETPVAFAGEKLAFLVHFACAEVSLVSPSPPQCVLCAKKFALRGLMVGVSAKKFALRRCVIVKARKSSPCALKTPQNRRLMARWASFFAEMPLDGRCWAKFFAEMQLEARCWASFFADRQSWAWSLGPSTSSVNPSMRSFTL